MKSKRDFSQYLNGDFNDLIESDQFREWVYNPSGEYRLFWNEFLQRYPEKTEMVKEAREFLWASRNYFESSDSTEKEIQAGFQGFMDQADISIKTADKLVDTKHRTLSPSYRWAMVAASILVLVVASFLFFTTSGPTTYTTDFGEWKTVELPDGSKVDLNANSELILASDWSAGATRQVWLKGEAFFNVNKQPSTNAKFQVITDDLTIEVLGTEFNVQDRGEQTEVYLQEGKIKLDLGIGERDLAPGDFISYSAEKSKVIAQNNIGAGDYASWKEGVLKLKNATILEILRKVEEIYGVEIMVSNKTMLSEKRTIGLPMKNLEIVVPILETTLGADISKIDNKLFVK